MPEETVAIVLVGPMGCGKTTIGRELSGRLGFLFYDADDFHPASNKEKMARGIPLNDADRQPWLKMLRALIDQHLAEDKSMVLACSALKEKYRAILGIDQKRRVSVLLQGNAELLEERIASRSHEYMSRELLQSQLETLEVPQDGLIVDISASPGHICDEIIDRLFPPERGA